MMDGKKKRYAISGIFAAALMLVRMIQGIRGSE